MESGTMEWNLNWRFWRNETTLWPTRKGSDPSRCEPRTVDDWEARLVQQGVSLQCASRIAAPLQSTHAELGRGSAAALILGASLAIEAQASEQASVERSLRDVREVERLLGAFSGELEKLDEVLEVLSAYAQRMRTKPSKTPDRTLH
jgi:hypothetical protein